MRELPTATLGRVAKRHATIDLRGATEALDLTDTKPSCAHRWYYVGWDKGGAFYDGWQCFGCGQRTRDERGLLGTVVPL